MKNIQTIRMRGKFLFSILGLFMCIGPSGFSQSRNWDELYQGWYAGISFCSIRNPIFFTGEPDSREEYVLSQTGQTIRLSGGYEINLEKVDALLGFEFCPASFGNCTQPIYDTMPESGTVTFEDMKYTLFLFDFAVELTPSGRTPIAFLAAFDIGFSIESYDRSSTADIWGEDLNGRKTRGHGQFGFAIGSRIFLSRKLAIEARYAWLIGEGGTTTYAPYREDENWIYYKPSGSTMVGPSGLFSLGVVVGLNPSRR
jgi:hypothetical protein